MSYDDTIRLNAQRLKGIAHPLRIRLLSLIREEGSATATRLAELTGQSTGATSYHLRQLASHGFVVEDEAKGTTRERWWKATSGRTTLEVDDVRDAPADAESYLRAVAAFYGDRIDRWLAQAPLLPAEWEHAATLSDTTFRLSPDEARALMSDVEQLFQRYRLARPGIEPDDGTERVVLQIQVLPFVRDTER